MVKDIEFCEVSPRDGLQNIETFIPTQVKLELVRRLVDAGVRYMQVTSFMSPRAVPQMRDAQEVAQKALEEFPQTRFNALVPNLFGAKRAYECGIREMVSAFSLSETHNMRNINRTHEQSYEELDKIRQAYPDIELWFGIGTAFGCPWEGESNVEQLLKAVRRGLSIGANCIELADPIGVAYPVQVEKYVKAVKDEYPNLKLAVHFHDTRSMGIVSTWTAIQNGVRVVHGSVGGLGGCPFAPGASGNIATEDLIFMLDRCGVSTGINYSKIYEVAQFAKESIPQGCFGSRQLLVPQDTYPIR